MKASLLFLLLLSLFCRSGPLTHAATLTPVVEVEEDVYSYTNANNGAGPMWCSGSTCLVRSGGQLFASGLETIPGVQPLNNCRWVFFERVPDGWKRILADPSGRTREPAPLAAFTDGRVFLSANPTLGLEPQPNGGAARPTIFQFSATTPTASPANLLPEWQGEPRFTEHSYRSFAADAGTGELVLLQNLDYTHAEWTFRDRTGKWAAHGQLKWPWGAEYDQPQPIRVCYPNVALKDRAVHFFGVSDVQEPYKAWREFKHELTGQHWDYDFRRLFYTWSRDVTREPFHEWIEIASRDKTCGWVAPGDLWLAPNVDVHLLWTERAIDERLRKKFFPEAKQSHSFHHAVLRDGKVWRRQTLAESTEAKPGIIASAGRFQPTPDGRLIVAFYAGGTGEDGKSVSENRVLEILPDGSPSAAVRIPLAHPFASYFTATPRAGSPPSRTLEMLGPRVNSGSTISYARVRLW